MINLRCLYCQTPFTVGRAEMLSALIAMDEKSQNHYDAHCPRCRRANSISQQRMELFFPNWRAAAKQQNSTSLLEDEPMPVSADAKTEPRVKTAKPATKKTTVAKTSAAEKKPRTEKSADSKKAATKKTGETKPSKPSKPSSKPSSKSSKK